MGLFPQPDPLHPDTLCLNHAEETAWFDEAHDGDPEPPHLKNIARLRVETGLDKELPPPWKRIRTTMSRTIPCDHQHWDEPQQEDATILQSRDDDFWKGWIALHFRHHVETYRDGPLAPMTLAEMETYLRVPDIIKEGAICILRNDKPVAFSSLRFPYEGGISIGTLGAIGPDAATLTRQILNYTFRIAHRNRFKNISLDTDSTNTILWDLLQKLPVLTYEDEDDWPPWDISFMDRRIWERPYP